MASTTKATTEAQNARVETMEYAAMMRRMLRGWERRLADADVEDLAELAGFTSAVDVAQRNVVRAWRQDGRSWREIGEAFGTTRQAAEQRFGHLPLP